MSDEPLSLERIEEAQIVLAGYLNGTDGHYAAELLDRYGHTLLAALALAEHVTTRVRRYRLDRERMATGFDEYVRVADLEPPAIVPSAALGEG